MFTTACINAGSGIFVGLLGVAYYAEIHHIAYFIVIQIFVGVFEVSLARFKINLIKRILFGNGA